MFLKHIQTTNTFDTKITLHSYILYWGTTLDYFQYSLECSRYSQIFQQEIGLNNMPLLKYLNIVGIAKSAGKIPMLYLIYKI